MNCWFRVVSLEKELDHPEWSQLVSSNVPLTGTLWLFFLHLSLASNISCYIPILHMKYHSYRLISEIFDSWNDTSDSIQYCTICTFIFFVILIMITLLGARIVISTLRYQNIIQISLYLQWIIWRKLWKKIESCDLSINNMIFNFFCQGNIIICNKVH